MDEADKAAIAAALQDSWSLLSPFFCFAVWICFLLVLNHFGAFGASIDMKTKRQMNVIWDAPDMYDIRMART